MTCYHQPSLQPGAVMDHVLEKCAVLSMKTREDVATLASSTSNGHFAGWLSKRLWSVWQLKMLLGGWQRRILATGVALLSPYSMGVRYGPLVGSQSSYSLPA